MNSKKTSLREVGKSFRTDKGDKPQDGLNRHEGHGYLPIYDFVTRNIKDDVTSVLELGVYKGESLRLWAEWFPNAKIYGFDIKDPIFLNNERIKDFKVNAETSGAIDICKKIKPDIIIDDASHKMSSHVKTFNNLWPLVNSGGLYIIEDLHTCYMESYGGEPSHDSKRKRTCEWYSEISKALNYKYYNNQQKNEILKKYPYVVDIDYLVVKEKILFIKKK